MSIAKAKPERAPWLLLLFSLPAKRATQRVGVWRRLQRYGAIALHNSSYLLPESAMNRERFEWLATTIRDSGGEASVASLQSINSFSLQQLVARFREARARDYQSLLSELRRLASATSWQKKAALPRLRSRFEELAEIDFFGCPLRERVREELERAATSPGGATAQRGKRLDRRAYRGRLWVTRPRPGIDRCASAWLIRRFIDPRARFAFASENRLPRAGVPFDMFHGGFGHHGNDCTFETLEKLYGIHNRKITRIAAMVHDADLADDKFGRKEGFGIDEVLKGWARQGLPDKQLLERGMELIEGLYRSLG